METLILILIVLFAVLAYINEVLSLMNISNGFYPPIIGHVVFYISTTLGILFIHQLYWILIILDLTHSSNKEDWNNYPKYRIFDYSICCIGFLAQLYWVHLYINK